MKPSETLLILVVALIDPYEASHDPSVVPLAAIRLQTHQSREAPNICSEPLTCYFVGCRGRI